MITQYVLLSLGALSFAQGCGDSTQAVKRTRKSYEPISKRADTGDAAIQPPDGGPAGAATCDIAVEEHPATSFDHVATCSEVQYDTNPPSGGNHYAIWPAFQEYTFPIPDGFLVHALEHGAVVFWYNCTNGCAGELARAEAFIDTLPVDPLCDGTGAKRRAILIPDPNLDTRWAASSWGWTLRATCFDDSAMREFYTAHYGNGREAYCGAGTAFTGDPCP